MWPLIDCTLSSFFLIGHVQLLLKELLRQWPLSVPKNSSPVLIFLQRLLASHAIFDTSPQIPYMIAVRPCEVSKAKTHLIELRHSYEQKSLP